MRNSTNEIQTTWSALTRLLGILLIVPALFIAGCDDDDDDGVVTPPTNGGGNAVENVNYDTTEVAGGPDEITVSDEADGRGIAYLDANGDPVTEVTWSSDFIYKLDGFVFVNEGETLNIEPGTIIQGEPGQGADASSLIVTRFGTINADGEEDDGTINPIIFTADGDNQGNGLGRDVRGRWGGVILLGNAPINSQPPTTQIEGIPDEVGGDRIRYGAENGDFDPNHSVGTFRYVSIRHTGTQLQGGDEIQGLTLGGVGAGSTIEYVESYASDDDGFEWFGGTVNTKYLIAAFASDDAFDIDEGYQGSNQFWLAVQLADNAGRIGEHDGGTDPEDGTPLATSVVSNATYIGIGPGISDGQISGDGNNPFLFQRDNNATSYHNTIFMDGRTNKGLNIEDLGSGEDARARWLAGDLTHENNLWWRIGPDYDNTTTFEDIIQIPRDDNDNPTGDGGEGWITTLADDLRDRGNELIDLDGDLPIQSIERENGDGEVITFDPSASGDATSGAQQPADFGATGGQNAEWTNVSYRGAFGSENWADWALISQQTLQDQ
jgi:hypothetical protein